MLKPVIKETVTVKIIKQIREMIQSGEFQPGNKIPSERELTEVLSVSRIAVREAIKSLEAKGLLEVKPGEGTFVKAPSSHDIIDPLTNFLISKHAFKELLEVRRIIEVELAGFSAERATEEDLLKINKALDLMESDIACQKNRLNSDFSFHNAVAKSSGNKLLAQMMLTVRDLMRESIFLTTKVEGSNYRAIDGHRQVYENIVKKDIEGSKLAMLKHLKQVEEDLLKAQQIILSKSKHELNLVNISDLN